MNPRSGGGKVVKFDLQRKAEALGARVTLLDGPGYVDVAALVREAVADGADLLGVAGGDGTQALVAGIAAEHDIPLLVISAGTRNHFALDLGLDRDDPSTCLGALRDGEEVRVDLGMIADRPFVNNASFGAYAEIVQSPEYRDNKKRTMLEMLPDLLSASSASALTVRTGDTTLTGEQAVLVSNNTYGAGKLRDMGRRARIDQGVLGVITGHLASTAEAVSVLRLRSDCADHPTAGRPGGRHRQHRAHHPGRDRRRGRHRRDARALHHSAEGPPGTAATQPSRCRGAAYKTRLENVVAIGLRPVSRRG